MVEQKYKSASTSMNKKHPAKLGKILCKHYASAGDTVLDYGGGKYDMTEIYLAANGIICNIYDPFNRDEEINSAALGKFDYDWAMLSNVLNVVAEKPIRLQILENVKKHLREDGILLVKVYEGDGSGILKVNEKRNSCQVNQKIRFYFWEVAAVFGAANTKFASHEGTKIIVAKNGKQQMEGLTAPLSSDIIK